MPCLHPTLFPDERYIDASGAVGHSEGMNLADELERIRMTRAQLSDALGVSPGMVSHWTTGRCRVTAEQAIAIERATSGRISRATLRPDVFGVPA